MNLKIKKNIAFLIAAFLSSLLLSCFDVSAVNDGGGPGVPKFASGPAYGTYYPFANGVIDAARETLGMFMENYATEGTLENATMLINGTAYMGLVQEDIFRYARDEYIAQYAADPDTAEKKYLKIASQLKVVMAAYEEDVFLLVNTGSAINSITDVTAGKTVNIGSTGSGTYITASTILDAHGLTPTRNTEDAATAVENVVTGTIDAAFMVAASPNATLQAIASDASVKLIQVTMPAGKKYYSETGSINAEDYAFQTESVSGNIQVKSLVAVGPTFNDRVIDIFIDHALSRAQEYSSYNRKWLEVSMSRSQQYMRDNPQVTNYKAICKVAGAPVINSSDLEPEIYSGDDGTSASDMAGELIWLLSHNLDIDLKEVNSTGARENAIRLTDGTCTMAMVQDDLFDFYIDRKMMDDSVRVASMKKVMPLHYEYLHLLVNTGSGIGSIANFPLKGVNVGPKTSGTFVTAMNVVKTYGFDEADNIFYYFDAPDIAPSRVDNAALVNGHTYDAAFVLSGLPYERYYSHDTWDVTTELTSSNLIAVGFNGTAPDAYIQDGAGSLKGNGAAIYEDYPYHNAVLGSVSISTVRVRSMLVTSPAFDDSEIATLIKATFRKAYYKTNPTDPFAWGSMGSGGDYQPDQLWLSVRKESVNTIADLDNDYGDVSDLTDRGYYDTVLGAKEYFMRNPYNWSEHSTEYFLSLFPDNN